MAWTYTILPAITISAALITTELDCPAEKKRPPWPGCIRRTVLLIPLMIDSLGGRRFSHMTDNTPLRGGF